MKKTANAARDGHSDEPSAPASTKPGNNEDPDASVADSAPSESDLEVKKEFPAVMNDVRIGTLRVLQCQLYILVLPLCRGQCALTFGPTDAGGKKCERPPSSWNFRSGRESFKQCGLQRYVHFGNAAPFVGCAFAVTGFTCAAGRMMLRPKRRSGRLSSFTSQSAHGRVGQRNQSAHA